MDILYFIFDNADRILGLTLDHIVLVGIAVGLFSAIVHLPVKERALPARAAA
ncbi:MAG: hypothetical protein ACPGUF_05235 [Litorivicinus sp.]